MSAHVLLNLLNKLGKFRNEFNKFNNVRFNLSYDIKITLKSHLCLKNVIILSLCSQHLLWSS